MKAVFLCIFPLFAPKKPPFWAFLIAIFAFLMHEKAALMRENLPLMDENPGFVHPPLFERGKTEHETNGFQDTKNGTKRHFQCAFRPYLCIWNKQNCPFGMSWNATPGHRNPNFPYITNISPFLPTEGKLSPWKGRKFFFAKQNFWADMALCYGSR